MTDRVPLYPGRVKLVPVSGQENVYDMTRADQPTQEGDPLNKATLLKDATAALFGLGADSVPDEAFAWIGKYNLHWWRRSKILGDIVDLSNFRSMNTADQNLYCIAKTGYHGSEKTVKYSENVNVYTSPVELSGGIKSVSVGRNNYTNAEVLIGKFYESSGGTVFYVPSDASIQKLEIGSVYVYASKIQKIDPFSEYLQSSNRSAYPDSGEQDGYEYQYLGIPFDNAVTAPKIATGSYVGTGTYGADNPNSLTFDGIPKMVCVFDSTGRGFTENGGGFIWIQGNVGSIGYNDNKFTQIGNTLSWYTDTADNQLNHESSTYVYLAIG